MAATFENLRVLQTAEQLADLLWKQVTQWEVFAKDVVGKQLARAADSIGANIAESFGRFSFGEKIQFLYYARGSLFETKYWLNRAMVRHLLPNPEAQQHIAHLTDLARQLNVLVESLKRLRAQDKAPRILRESSLPYVELATEEYSLLGPLFDDDDLIWLEASPITIP